MHIAANSKRLQNRTLAPIQAAAALFSRRKRRYAEVFFDIGMGCFFPYELHVVRYLLRNADGPKLRFTRNCRAL